MLLIDVRNELWRDALLFFQKKILSGFKKILEKILTDLDKTLEGEIVRTPNKMVVLSYPDPVPLRSLYNLLGCFQE